MRTISPPTSGSPTPFATPRPVPPCCPARGAAVAALTSRPRWRTSSVLGRNGLGSPLFAATGNGFADSVAYPASDANSVAVGASTDQAKIANYSNVGPQTSVVAPSSGGKEGIYTTDVGLPNRGFSIAAEAAGLHTATFGGTSSATPLAAGIGALVLSVNPKLRQRGGEGDPPALGHQDRLGLRRQRPQQRLRLRARGCPRHGGDRAAMAVVRTSALSDQGPRRERDAWLFTVPSLRWGALGSPSVHRRGSRSTSASEATEPRPADSRRRR